MLAEYSLSGKNIGVERTVLVVEDEALMRDMVAALVRGEGFEVRTAANAAEAVDLCRACDPDALIIDINLGSEPNGLQLAEALVRESPGCAVIFLTNLPDARFTSHPSPQVLERAAYLRKSQLHSSNELVRALNDALGERVNTSQRHDQANDRPLAQLSKTQFEVLQLLSEGLTNEQISEQRGTTTRSVERIIARIFRALNIDPAEGNPRVEATRAYLLAMLSDA